MKKAAKKDFDLYQSKAEKSAVDDNDDEGDNDDSDGFEDWDTGPNRDKRDKNEPPVKRYVISHETLCT